MSGETWTVPLTVSVLGVWLPDDEPSCARLIAAVNRERTADDPRPRIVYGWAHVGGDPPSLIATLDEQEVELDAGEFLIRAEVPRGVVWSSMPPADVDVFRPAVRPARAS